MVPAEGGRAWRLTAGVAEAGYPRFSPDGRQLAFVGREEGPDEVYVMPADGGPARRVTYQGARCTVTGWDAERIGDLRQRRRPAVRRPQVAVPDQPGRPEDVPHRLPYGPANSISYGPGGGIVLGRNTADPARWKRYRGGTVGDLWIDRDGAGEFRRLISPRRQPRLAPAGSATASTSCPTTRASATSTRARPTATTCAGTPTTTTTTPATCPATAAGWSTTPAADLYLLDPAEDEARRVDVRLGSSRTQRNRRFVPADGYLDSATLSPDGSGLAITTRGKAYSLRQLGGAGPPARRARRRALPAAHLAERRASGSSPPPATRPTARRSWSSPPTAPPPPRRLDDLDTGRAVDLARLPDGRPRRGHQPPQRAAARRPGRRGPAQATMTSSTPARYGRIDDPAWSPDGRWLAYTYPDTGPDHRDQAAPGRDGRDRRRHPAGAARPPPRLRPGRRLPLLHRRSATSTRSTTQLQFDLGFPLGTRPYAIALRADVPARSCRSRAAQGPSGRRARSRRPPGRREAAGTEARRPGATGARHGRRGARGRRATDARDRSRRASSAASPRSPCPRAATGASPGIKGKALFSIYPVRGRARRRLVADADGPSGSLRRLRLREAEARAPASSGVTDFAPRPRRHDPALPGRPTGCGCSRPARSRRPTDDDTPGPRERLDRPRPGQGVGPPGRRSGGRCSARPGGCSASTSGPRTWPGIDWDAVYDRYLPLVDRVTHPRRVLRPAVGAAGRARHLARLRDRRRVPARPALPPGLPRASTGSSTATRRLPHRPHRRAATTWDPRGHLAAQPARAWTCARATRCSPINGQPVGGPATAPASAWSTRPTRRSQLTVRRGDERAAHGHGAGRLRDERPARYRDWVEANRAHVHERTGGRVGYSTSRTWGRRASPSSTAASWPSTTARRLIVDVRFNGGGHVSALLLEKLARRRLGYDFPRWGVPEPYPPESPRGPLVALTNELAGLRRRHLQPHLQAAEARPAGRQAHLGRRDRHLAAPPARRRHA